MVFGFTVYMPTDLLKFFCDLSCSFAVLLLPWDQDWSSCLVELLVWFFPFVLGVPPLEYQI